MGCGTRGRGGLLAVGLWLVVLGSGGCHVDPTLSDIQAKIFDRRCNQRSCHSGAGDGMEAGGLALDEGRSFGELVGVAAEGDMLVTYTSDPVGRVRVIAGDPDGSFLMDKLLGADHLAANEGRPMPNVEGNNGLPQYELDAIREWIAEGALDN